MNTPSPTCSYRSYGSTLSFMRGANAPSPILLLYRASVSAQFQCMSTWTRLIVCVELRSIISCEPHDRCGNNRRRFWSSGMTPALQECLGRGLLTDPLGDSAEKQLDGSRLERYVNSITAQSGDRNLSDSLRLARLSWCRSSQGSLSQERNVHVERISVRGSNTAN